MYVRVLQATGQSKIDRHAYAATYTTYLKSRSLRPEAGAANHEVGKNGNLELVGPTNSCEIDVHGMGVVPEAAALLRWNVEYGPWRTEDVRVRGTSRG